LVCRLWCEIAVRILWKDSQHFKASSIKTLVACFQNESKENLRNNGIIIPAPTSNPPLFNYAAYCRRLSIHIFNSNIRDLLKTQQFNSAQDLEYKVRIVGREIFKLFMDQISSLKYWDF